MRFPLRREMHAHLVDGRQITRGHYEAVADLATSFELGDALNIRRNRYTWSD